jgi:hypothetical protein
VFERATHGSTTKMTSAAAPSASSASSTVPALLLPALLLGRAPGPATMRAAKKA